MGAGPFFRRRRAARGGACAVVEVPFVSCERFLALGQRRAGAERVNPLPDAVPSSRPLHTARARARARRRGAAREVSFGGLDAFLLRNRIGAFGGVSASCICAWPSTRVVGVP